MPAPAILSPATWRAKVSGPAKRESIDKGEVFRQQVAEKEEQGDRWFGD
jgi:hypothetical protein